MIDRQLDIPLYQQIKQKLARSIESLEPHKRIPSEPKLAEIFGVSRGTVQQAINELVTEGLLYRIPKSGTYVRPPIIQRHFQKLPSYSEDIRQRGLTPGAWLIELAMEIPNRQISRYLNIRGEGTVWRVKRVHTADEEPVILSTSYLPTLLVPELTKEDVLKSLYHTLDKRYQKRPTWAHETYTAQKADQVIASLLGVTPDTALLKAERISFLNDGQIVEYALSFIRGDRFEIHIDINSPR